MLSSFPLIPILFRVPQLQPGNLVVAVAVERVRLPVVRRPGKQGEEPELVARCFTGPGNGARCLGVMDMCLFDLCRSVLFLVCDSYSCYTFPYDNLLYCYSRVWVRRGCDSM